MCGAVLANAECIVSPDILDGEFHEGRDAHGGFHIVGEYEECAASADDTAVEGDTVHHRGHGELGHTCVEEGAREIAFLEGMCLLEEGIGLVGVGEVGRRDNHVADLLGQDSEHVSRSLTRCDVGLVGYGAPVDFGELVVEIAVEFLGQPRVGGLPGCLLLAACFDDGAKLLAACLV